MQPTKQQLNPAKMARILVQLCAVLALLLMPLLAISKPQETSPALAWLQTLKVVQDGTSKVSSAPLVQFDTGSKYFKVMIEGLVQNFKRSVYQANDKLSLASKSIPMGSVKFVAGQKKSQSQSIDGLQLSGFDRLKVSSVNVNKKNLKLNVVFAFDSIQLNGSCSAENIVHLEATKWHTNWTASLPAMINLKDSLDMSKVQTSHSYSHPTLKLSGCFPASMAKLEESLLTKAREAIESRLATLMENVMLQQVQGSDSDDEAAAPTSTDKSRPISYKNETLTAPKVLRRVKRQTPCQQGDELDDYVDQLLRFGTRIIRAMEPITLPNATIELPDYNLKIFLYEGKGSRAYKFRRAKPAWVFCSNETISLGLTIELEELRVAYKYRVISGSRLVFDGDLEARLQPKAQAQFSQAVQEEDSEDPVQQRVDRVRLFRLGKVHVIIRGLGNLTHSISMLINGYLNDNQEELQPTFRMLEGDAVRLINRLLANVNVPLLSVV